MTDNSIKPTAATEYFRKSGLQVPAHSIQAIMYKCPKRLNYLTLKFTMRTLCACHDILRACWNGERLVVRERDCIDLVGVDEYNLYECNDIDASLSPIIQRLQSGINLSTGPLVRTALFHLPEYDAVYIVIHRLIIDGVSFRIITEDIESIYNQLSAGRGSVKLPKILCTFSEYADAVQDYAESGELLKELQYWMSVSEHIRSHNGEMPVDNERKKFVRISIDHTTSQRVITQCIEKYRVEVNDLLLTAFARAWKSVTDKNQLTVAMWSHGRNSLKEYHLNLDRTVGWFTAIYPVVLECGIKDPAAHIDNTSATLHNIPDNGFGYGNLLHITHKEEIACTPELIYNFYGSHEEGGSASKLFNIDYTIAADDDSSQSDNDCGESPLSIIFHLANGSLTGDFWYSPNILLDNEAELLIEEFKKQLSNF